MSAIIGLPNEYDFGYDFNYAVWSANTKVTMVNVPWNNDYRDIVKFADRPALNAYINSIQGAGIVVDNVSYLKPNHPIRLEIPMNVATRFNYLRASNPVQPVNGDVAKDYYYFITDVRYIAPGTTEFVLQLDVWQSFGFDATFGNCYIERGHIGVANSNQFQNYGRDYLTIPEGIDTGGEYQIVTRANKAIMATEQFVSEDVYNLLVVSTVDLQANPGADADHARLNTATGGLFAGMPSGATQYLWPTAASFQAWLTRFSDKPWVTQGIVSVTMVPPISRYGIIGWADNDDPTPVPSYKWLPKSYSMLNNWRTSSTILNNIPARYRALKKFLTFPYMILELTTFSGTPVVMKPESWADDDATLVERINPAPPDQRVAISPYKYNAVPGSPSDDMLIGSNASSAVGMGDDHGDYIDLATYITNFPTLAIVNNNAALYLANNAHSVAFQNSSADWSQQRALRGNETSYDQASAGMNLANDLTGINTGAANASNELTNSFRVGRAIVGGIGSIAGGIAGGPAGAAGGLGAAAMGNIGAILDINQSNQQTAINVGATRGANNAQVGQQGYIRDTNRGLADWAARGDYENSIAGINAKVQDSRMTQPTTSGQVGGDAMNILNNNAMVSLRFKMIDQSAIRVIGEYWLRYGYAVRKFSTLPPTLMAMSKFTYWKLTETYLNAGMMPESFKQVIRGIFEKGVTVWANPADIGNIDIAANTPLGGITL